MLDRFLGPLVDGGVDGSDAGTNCECGDGCGGDSDRGVGGVGGKGSRMSIEGIDMIV